MKILKLSTYAMNCSVKPDFRNIMVWSACIFLAKEDVKEERISCCSYHHSSLHHTLPQWQKKKKENARTAFD